MLHKSRVWCVENVNNAEELAILLTTYTHSLCAGFRYNKYLFLNDSFSENGIQEYGIINESTGRQVETITFSWCNYSNALKYINLAVAGYYDYQSWSSDIDLAIQIKSPENHECYLCR